MKNYRAANQFSLFHSQYCRSIREQILSSFTHRNFSIMVVGNKFDLVVDSPNYSQVKWRHCIAIFFEFSFLFRRNWRMYRRSSGSIGDRIMWSAPPSEFSALYHKLFFCKIDENLKTFFPRPLRIVLAFQGTTTKWTTSFERLWGFRVWMDAPEPE